MSNPLEQFKIKYLTDFAPVAGMNLNFSNSSLFMVIAVALIGVFMCVGIRERALVPGRLQSMVELSYEFIANLLKDNVGPEGGKYFPFIFSLFMFVLVCNLLGMLPYAFTVTSHIAVTFALAALIFVCLVTISLARHGLHFFSFFLPHGTPWWLAPMMVVIEFFAYLARPVSLSVRLFANMLAGHILLKVIAGFVIALGAFWGWGPLAFMVVMSGFEVGVAILQAYIFAILTCVYLNDAIHLH